MAPSSISGTKSVGLRAGSIGLLLVLWWAGSWLMDDPEVVPGPVAIGLTIGTDLTHVGPDGNSAFLHIGLTLSRIIVAFAASMLARTGIGLAMGLNAVLESASLIVIPLMLTMPTILMGFPRRDVVRIQRGRRAGRRYGSGHPLCRGEYIRRHQGDGQVPRRDGRDVQGAQVAAHSQGLSAAVDALYFLGIPLCVRHDLEDRSAG